MRKVIYTCITNGYDFLENPLIRMGDWDYVCFTDDVENTKNPNWEIRPIPEDLLNIPKEKIQRAIKVNPHIYLSEYDESIWVDGNIIMIGDINHFVEHMCGESNISIPKHPINNCAYVEYAMCRILNKDTKERMMPQMVRYKSEGYPSDNGLVQSGIIYRKHNAEDCVRLMNKWWEEIKNGSHRDQLSFNYSAWVTNVKFDYIDKDIFYSNYFHSRTNHYKDRDSHIIA